MTAPVIGTGDHVRVVATENPLYALQRGPVVATLTDGVLVRLGGFADAPVVEFRAHEIELVVTAAALALHEACQRLVDDVVVYRQPCPDLTPEQRAWALEQLDPEYGDYSREEAERQGLTGRDLLAAVYSRWSDWIVCNL